MGKNNNIILFNSETLNNKKLEVDISSDNNKVFTINSDNCHLALTNINNCKEIVDNLYQVDYEISLLKDKDEILKIPDSIFYEGNEIDEKNVAKIIKQKILNGNTIINF